MEPEDHFSKEYIDKKVSEGINNHSLTLFPAAGGVLGLLYGGLFANPIALAVGGLAVGLSAGYYAFQKYVKFDSLSKKLVDRLREEQLAQIRAKLGPLQSDLKGLGCHQGVEQVDRLETKFEDLKGIIYEKLKDNPTKANRLHALAEQLYLATIDNLVHAKQLLQSVANINEDYITSQIARAHSDEERESLEERLQLLRDGIDSSEDCIASNEVAMTKINQLAITLAKSKHSKFDMEQSLHEITNNVRVEQWQAE